jgi:aspartate carbamoyltransferase regulatory subunit
VWVLTAELCNVCEPYSPTCPLFETLLDAYENSRPLIAKKIEQTVKDPLLRAVLLERNRTEDPSFYAIRDILQDIVKGGEYATPNGDCFHKRLLSDELIFGYFDWQESLHKTVLKMERIENGTVIDHVLSGHALDVLKVLKISGKEGFVVSLAMNVASRKYRKKDLIMLEDLYLPEDRICRIALISPNVTINIIKNGAVESKEKVTPPDDAKGLIKCYPTCISSNPNSREPITTRFLRIFEPDSDDLQYRCYYCGRAIRKQEMLDRLIL